MWHVNRYVTPNEKINDDGKTPVGDFHFHNGKWILINRRLNNMWDVSEQDNHKQIAIGSFVELTEGKKILLDKDTANGGRLIVVQLVGSSIPPLEYKSKSGDPSVFEYNEESDCDMYNYFAKDANYARQAYYNSLDLAERERMKGLICEHHAKDAEQYIDQNYEESEVNPFAIEAREYWERARRCFDKEADYLRQADYYLRLYEEAVCNASKYDDD
jgi:hypothetical protein